MRYSSTLLNQCILGVTLNFDLARLLILYITLMCGHKCLVRISDISSLFVAIQKYLNFEKRPMLYYGIFSCHEHYVTLFGSMHCLAMYIV